MRETASPRAGCGTHGRVFSSTATMQHTSSRLDKSSQSQRLPPGLQHTMRHAAPAKLMPQRLCQVGTFCRQPQLVEPDIMWPGCIAKQKPTLWLGPSVYHTMMVGMSRRPLRLVLASMFLILQKQRGSTTVKRHIPVH